MTPRKRPENALGKGLDALIRKDYLDEDEEKPKKSGKKQTKSTGSTKTSVKDKKAETAETDVSTQIQESSTPSVDDKIVDAVLLEVHKNPRISLWSAKSAAVLRFLKKTKPEFSISNEASLLIEEAVKDRHPDIWKIFEEKGL